MLVAAIFVVLRKWRRPPFRMHLTQVQWRCQVLTTAKSLGKLWLVVGGGRGGFWYKNTKRKYNKNKAFTNKCACVTLLLYVSYLLIVYALLYSVHRFSSIFCFRRPLAFSTKSTQVFRPRLSEDFLLLSFSRQLEQKMFVAVWNSIEFLF